MSVKEKYNRIVSHLRKLKDLSAANALMQWDQEVYMPINGGVQRGQQLATLSAVYHEYATNKEYIQNLKDLIFEESLTDKEKRNVEEALRDAKNSLKFNVDFVKRKSLLISKAFHTWEEARKQNDYSIYAPVLKEMVDLKKEEARIWGFIDHPYDALLDQYERGMRSNQLESLFEKVKDKLIPFINEIRNKETIDRSPFQGNFDKDKQWNFGIDLLKDLGYDFSRGRQDLSTHPFTISFGSNDVRVTTRVKEDNISEMIWSCIHEGGHALYEQGLLEENYGLASGEACSLSIHESQSRLYENNLGRSREYWIKNFELIKSYFPGKFEAVDFESFYKAMNAVKPSLIRTSADELTYHFHVIIRFEIEKGLMEGSIKVEDLDKIWNKKYKDYLGVEVPDDNQGVLQDVHWAHGGFGYFPTYSLGSFYGAQFFAHATKSISGLKEEIEQGNYHSLLTWLRKEIHQYGKTYNSQELCDKVTGEALNIDYFMNYVHDKYGEIYNLAPIES